jgi:hypothetical protein
MDMVRSLVPLVVVILVIVWLSSPDDVDPVRDVDPGPTLAYAATVANFDVLAARRLPDGWRATSARVDPPAAQEGDAVTVTVGYVTPSEEFAEVVQGSGAEGQLLVDVLGEEYTASDVSVDGWRVAETAGGELALLHVADGSNVIVTGSADEIELRVLADSLRPGV